MRFLTQDQIDNFWRDGVLVVEDAVCAKDLADLRSVFGIWVEESRAHESDFGVTFQIDPRVPHLPFDTGPNDFF